MRGFYGNIIEQSERSGAYTQHVIDIHRHAVDPDGVVLVHHFSDNDFCAHAIRRSSNTEPISDIDDVSKIAQRQFDSVRLEIKRTLNPVREIVHDSILLFRVNTGPLVRRTIAHWNTSTGNSLNRTNPLTRP